MQSLDALADPTRRAIVEMLAVRERSAGEIVAQFDVTPPAISQHLKILRRARLVTVRAEGQRRIHSLDRTGFDEIDAWLAKTKRFWEQRLDALEETLRAEDARQQRKKKR
jgi:DNA-binding transcriptional ArsR family regulator